MAFVQVGVQRAQAARMFDHHDIAVFAVTQVAHARCDHRTVAGRHDRSIARHGEVDAAMRTAAARGAEEAADAAPFKRYKPLLRERLFRLFLFLQRRRNVQWLGHCGSSLGEIGGGQHGH
jgi:hypothetical protein